MQSNLKLNFTKFIALYIYLADDFIQKDLQYI